MNGLQWFLVAVLVADALQLMAAAAALAQGRRRRDRAEELLAGYSFRHSGLLAAGSVALAIPAALGLLGPLAPRTAVWVVVATEVAAVLLARPVLVRLHTRFTA